MNTILTPQLFNQYCNDYYLTNKTNALNNSVTTTLPITIKNVELSLNTMTNGKLYKQYNPSNLKFNGVGNLDASAEQDTLYSLLTEAVLYRIQTGAFVNVSNTFGGNITGLNHFSSSNSNVIGLRNDIRDKLVALQLYKNANYTNPTVNQPPQLLSDKPLTIQQASAINNWLSTNNFTLGGNWNFANLNIDGVNITQFIQNQLSTQGGDYSEVLINYLPKTQIPLITSNDIQSITNNTNSIQSLSNSVFDNQNKVAQYGSILSNYLSGNSQVPMITSANMNTWNQAASDLSISNKNFSTILQNYIPNHDNNQSNFLTIPLITQAQITTWNTYQGILSNYSGGSTIPSITTQDISNWNSASQDLGQVMMITNHLGNIISNYTSPIPLITQADITKWNTNTGGNGGGSVNITKQVYTLTITNTWQIQYSNGVMSYQGSNLSITPSLPSGLDISIQSVDGSIGSPGPTINITVSGKTIINSLIYSLEETYNSTNEAYQYLISPIQYMPLSTTDNITWSITPNCEVGYWQANTNYFNPFQSWIYDTGSYNNPFPLLNNTITIQLSYNLGSSNQPSTYPANSTLQEPMTLYLELVYC